MITNAIKKLMEFFEEGNGQLSNTRLNSTIMIWCGCLILVGGSFKYSGSQLDANTISAAIGLITYGTGSKLIQKSQEIKSTVPGNAEIVEAEKAKEI